MIACAARYLTCSQERGGYRGKSAEIDFLLGDKVRLPSMSEDSPLGLQQPLRPAHSGVAAGQLQQCFAFVSQALLDPMVARPACAFIGSSHESILGIGMLLTRFSDNRIPHHRHPATAWGPGLQVKQTSRHCMTCDAALPKPISRAAPPGSPAPATSKCRRTNHLAKMRRHWAVLHHQWALQGCSCRQQAHMLSPCS